VTGDDGLGALLRPLRINTLELPNRIVMGPMAVLQPTKDGRPSVQTIAFLEARARGGVGLIIVGGAAGSQRMLDEAPYHPLLRLDRDDDIPGLRRVVDAVHQHGTPIIAEVMAGFGRMGKPSQTRPIISASPKNVVMAEDRFPHGIRVPGGKVTPLPREATVEEIRQIERDTVEAAVRMGKAGFDGVEIAAHMSYFLASFLSPRTNWRTDEYGGSPENRARVLVNVVRMVRHEVGADYPVGLRMSANDHVDGGQGPEGFAEIAGIVAREGLDYIALTDGNYEAMDVNTPTADGAMVDHGEPQAFRRQVDVPLLLSNINDPRRAAEALDAGHGDAVMLARQLLADPEYANKVRDGRVDEIVWCDRSNECLRRLLLNFPVRCHRNPRMGREGRTGRGVPPARLARRPVEEAALALTGSERLMGLASKAARRKPVKG
jgi:2,4-dienoyl-CoA reductase-like NADH-dependent reductase (Old Yellow Enzyme family)